MKQKRCIGFLLTLCILLGMMQVSVFADTTDSITVNVSIAKDGDFVTGKDGTRIAYTPVTITDVNGNESYDIDDVLYATHELYYDEGAASGYSSQNTEYGLSLIKLWGDDSGAFRYYKDNQSAMSLADSVTDGSNIYAFIYQDKTSWSDTYTYFKKAALSVETGKPLSVQLNKSVYDDNWNPVELPVKNATVTINGEVTEHITNDDGVAEIVFDSVGSYTLSAITDDYISTPPVCIVTVKEKTDTQTPPTTDNEDTPKPDTPTDNEKKEYNVVIPDALEKIAATYKNKTDEWTVMDMGAYEMYAPQTENKLTNEARQKYINNAIATIKDSESDTAVDKAVLGLVAIGKNPELLYSVNSNTAISAIERLNGVAKSTSAWYAPYTLAAYNQGDYDTDSYETEIINALLAKQQQDGSWDEWGTIDTTANVIAGLSFYKDRPKVDAAIENAVNYLSAQQTASGTFSDGYSGANSNSTAMVIIGLAAAGVDLQNDTRFIKNDNNIIDGLLSFLVADGGGFGHTDNASISSYSTEQAFRALIAFMQTMKTGKPFNVYDFSKNELTPARATGSNSSSSQPSEPSGENITVTMSIKADTGYWLNNYSTTIPKEGATVYHAFVKACSENSITHQGAENGYVSSITKGNITLAEFDKGENSGWLYKVNGELPTVGLTDFSINDGDNIVWYYTEDWIKDPSAGHYDDSSSIDDITVDKTKDTTGTKTEIKTETAISSDTANVFTDVSEHWAIDAIEYVYKHSIMQGVSETEFAPDDTMTRAMLVTVLYRLENPTEKAKSHSFTDVKESEWYADAVSWGAENGIINGINETKFAPKEDITREQMAAVLYRYAQYKEQDTSIGEDTNILSYTDAMEISEYAISAIQWMTGAGLMKGETEASINPKNNSTRAQVATILMRYLEQR